jgi:hypothetical protein
MQSPSPKPITKLLIHNTTLTLTGIIILVIRRADGTIYNIQNNTLDFNVQ